MSEGSVLTLRHWPTLQGLKEFSLAASPFLQLVALVGLLCLMEGPTRISVKSSNPDGFGSIPAASL